ncbi:hypothetical protein MLD38_020655 [Melastoma candidum]|uniref:Uncharacterized protein n=1 Tax=Melastoma candidum TaxID=119954 RepID=A0ACB9QGK6_9MYRT|nr:hypothetical protein MLD38_020655 [Melastoma candidum]
MECNKEEALRAKDIAETRMQKNDFTGALRIAQKAQHLFPELANMAHMLAVCEVHCSAQKKAFGSEVDWYAILQVEKTVDETTLKKQFRKLALLLHPDKNKFPAAEAAFKLIGEANRVLSDWESRSSYDVKCRKPVIFHSSHAPKPPSHQQMPWSGSGSKQESRPPHFHPVVPGSDGKLHGASGYPQTHLGTFWTRCSSCHHMFEYLRHFKGKSLHCQSCGAAFDAHEWCEPDFGQNVQHGQSASHSTFTTVQFSQPDACNKGASSSSMQSENASRRTDGAKGTADSSQNGSDTGKSNPGTGEKYPFGSFSWQKQRVFAKKNLDNEVNFVRPPKRAKSHGAIPVDKRSENPHGKHDPKCDEARGLVRCPDPEFNNFDKLRNNFSADQIWACYDEDGMPRYYAQIKKVLCPGFRLQFVWLEYVPKSDAEHDWSSKKLPIACGYYKMGRAEETEGRLMFSHRMDYVKLQNKSRERIHCIVYPRKGEIWAMSKNWDISWMSDPKKHLPRRYEYVEVLSDFEEDLGVRVACLHRLLGFVSLYKRVDEGNDCENAFYQIPPNEKYRFSHQVPSFKMTGKERADVPSGSVELDPTSLDLNELHDSLEKDRAKMRFHGTKLDCSLGSKMSNSGKNSREDRKVVMGLSAQFLVRKLNPEPGRTLLDKFSANKGKYNVTAAGGASHNVSRPSTSSSCFNVQSVSTKEDPAKSKKGVQRLRAFIKD